MAKRAPARPAKKLFYKIGEVCEMTETEPYVLRYWESEFPFLAPSKNRSGQRIYKQTDIDMVRRIKELLYGEGYTIAGARRRLEDEFRTGKVGKVEEGEPPPPEAAAPTPSRGETPAASSNEGADEVLRAALRGVRDELRSLLQRLQPPRRSR